ncbi:MAG: YlmC/YmxH family sporulation protein [Ruminococcaceae bacterium]|nr:YlmC/YmxH family sporulation protein [Oscillospiraceae bacterium]
MRRLNDILRMEVINLFDGRRVGFVSDVAADFHTGKIDSLVIYGAARFFGFRNKKKDIVIPYAKVVSVGEDLIIVDMDEDLCKIN